MSKLPSLQNFQNSLNAKVFLALGVLHSLFIVVFDQVSAFAPDELGYKEVFSNLYQPDFSLDGYLGWQQGSINALRVIYLPAKLLEIIGFSDLHVVRILSSVYSMLSLFLLIKMAPTGKILKLSIRS